MNLLITGAAGFLGRWVVKAAAERGHHVRALVRSSAKTPPSLWNSAPGVEPVTGDLRNRRCIDSLLQDMDGVIHLAAAKTGSFYEQFAATVTGTENLIAAMKAHHVRHMVLCSTFSVYDYLNRYSWAPLDEASPEERHPLRRDAYCQTKRLQEQLVQETAQEHNWKCVILRPGVIFGPQNLWTARLGHKLGANWWIQIGAFAPLPLTYVENCADAFVCAAEYSGDLQPLVLNVVDDAPPLQSAYCRALCRTQQSPGKRLTIPWSMMRALASTACLANKFVFSGQGRLPGLLQSASLHARFKPLRYSNRKVKETLAWAPRYTWQEGLERSIQLNSADSQPLHHDPSKLLAPIGTFH